MGKKSNFYIKPATYSVLLSTTKSQNAAKAQHILKEGYGVPDMFRDFGHGAGKAYSEMNKYEKGLFWLFIFGIGGYVADATLNDGKAVKYTKDKLDKVYKSIAKKTPAVVIGADTLANQFSSTPAPTPVPTVMNASAKEMAAPNYYDEVEVNGTVYKVGIKIDGDDLFKHNVTQMLKTMKDVTPERYKEVIPYAPKKIMRSPDNFNWYGGSPNDDVIQLAKASEEEGGSDNINVVKSGMSDLYPEMRNAKQSKTGVTFNSTYESEMDVVSAKAHFKVELGLWSNQQAENYINKRSEDYKSGKFYNGAKLS